MESPTLLIASQQTDFVSIQPLYRMDPSANDYWDGNWIKCEVRIASGSFKAKYQASLRCDEFESFHQDLKVIMNDLNGKATFSSMETWLEINATGDGLGHFIAKCQATDIPGVGSVLNFILEFDQTQIEAMLTGVTNILEKFPVVGSPND